MPQTSPSKAFGPESHLQLGQRGTGEVVSAVRMPHFALIACLGGALKPLIAILSTRFRPVSFLIVNILSSTPDFKIKQMMPLILKQGCQADTRRVAGCVHLGRMNS